MKHPARIAAGVAAASLAAAGLTVAGLAHAAAVPAQITVQPATVGNAMPAGFAGFPIPPAQLAVNDFANTNVTGYLKTLSSTGVIRIGGNSGDTTFWTSTGEGAPGWATGTITPASLKSLASVAQASGWKVILSVNLKHNDPARAADEARNAQQILGSSLLGIEIGNEPTFYYTSSSAYFHDFEVTEQVTLNASGASDGSVTLSYDGKQVISQTGLDITNTNSLAGGLFFSTFFGGHDSSWAPSADQSIGFKDFSVSS
jgi:hypothetical protein